MDDLKRRVFGYSVRNVRDVLANRARLLQLALTNARSAEDRAERLTAQLTAMQRLLADAERRLGSCQDVGEHLAEALERSIAEREALEAKLELQREELERVKADVGEIDSAVAAKDAELRAAADRLASLEAELAAAPTRGDARDPSSVREIRALLDLTEHAVVHLLESARADRDVELDHLESERRRLRHEVDALRAWRDRMAPLVRSFDLTIEDVLTHVQEVGARVELMVRPVTEAVTRMRSQFSLVERLRRDVHEVIAGERAGPADGPVVELPSEETSGRWTSSD